MEMKSSTWLLGSNSESGFHSLYGGFCRDEGGFLRVIKGGPGTGKSSFMRRVAAEAESRGLAVERIICSGDPASLDAVYIPELRLGYADGTSPHVLDPAVFGADGDYLNIGECCDARQASHLDSLGSLSAGYRGWYARAYELLRAAAAVSPSVSRSYVTAQDRAAAVQRAAGVAMREFGREKRRGAVKRRFLGGMTCAGRILLKETLSELCPRLYLLDNRLGLGFDFAGEIARQAVSRGEDAIICPHYLRPELTEAVLLPSLGVGWAAVDPLCSYPEQHRRLHLDRAGAETLRALRPQLREDEKLEERLLNRAGQCLAAAKAVHDELEAALRPYVDFDALTALADREIGRIFV